MVEATRALDEGLELVAVIGMAGRFPGADGTDGSDCVETLWSNLCAGKESIRHFSPEELVQEGEKERHLADPNYVPARGILEGEELFDAGLFGIPPREAALTDPQHRIFLECAWEALEVAGYGAGGSRVGVFSGSTLSTYLLRHLLGHGSRGGLEDWQTGLHNEKDSLSTRVSYRLDLKGPSLAVSTACSTSLVAVHLACQSLLAYECEMALAGGVTLRCPQRRGYLYHPEGILSRDGHCRAFDADANGVVFGSGAGVVLLKRLNQAIDHGDTIRAVILGSAMNNDGGMKAGFTAPAEDGQAEVIAQALAMADVDPGTIGYIEGHGTGTPLGDPIEVAALARAFRTGTRRRGFCALGSLKPNIGHLDSAAGVAGLIKAVLAVERGLVPPCLHYHRPNPNLDLGETPFFVNTECRPWHGEQGLPRRAGVSAFGIGGTNAHVILQQAPMAAPAAPPARSWQLLLLAGRTASAVNSLSGKLAAVFSEPEDHRPDLAAAAYTLAVGRRRLPHRRVVVARDVPGAVEALAAVAAGKDGVNSGHLSSTVAFLFPGQGSQYVDMGRGLYDGEPVFRQTVDHCADIVGRELGWDLRSLLYSGAGEEDRSDLTLDATEATQPVLFTFQVAMASLWRSWGIEPSQMLGHSLGEWVCAHLAGVWTLEEALRLVALRGRLMAKQPRGAMLAVPLSKEEILLRLPGELAVAAINGPAATVVSGASEAVAAYREALSAEGVESRLLATSHAFHSPLMEGVAAPFLRALENMPPSAPSIPFLSNLSGTWIREEEAKDPSYWVRQMLSPVLFEAGLSKLFEAPHRILLEVGPGQSLGGLARRHRGFDPATPVISSSRHRDSGADDQQALLEALGRLWTVGVEANWQAFYGEQPPRRVPLPTYPFEKKRHWIEPVEEAVEGVGFLGRRPDPDTWFSMPTWQRDLRPQGGLEGEERRFLVVDGGPIAEALERAGARVIRAFWEDPLGEGSGEGDPAHARSEISKWLEGGTPAALVYGGAVGVGTYREEERRAFEIPARWASALRSLSRERGVAPPELVVVSEGLHRVVTGDRVVPVRGLLIGLCRSLAAGEPGWSVRCLDFEVDRNDHEASLTAEILYGREATVAWRGGDRWVETLLPLPLPLPLPQRPPSPGPKVEASPLVAGGCYLITGGLGSTGLALARKLAAAVPLRLAFLEGTESPGASGALPEAVLDELRNLGTETLVVRAEGRDEGSVAAALETVRQHFGQLRGVLHLAARAPQPSSASEEHPVQEEAPRALAEVRTKIRLAFHLDALLRGEPLDFYVCFSSFAGLLGLPGASLTGSAFAASASCLDLLCQARQEREGRLAVAVHWGQNLGFRDFEEEWPRYLAAVRRLGVSAAEATAIAFSEDEAYDCLVRVLAAEVGPRVLVSSQRPEALRAVMAEMREEKSIAVTEGHSATAELMEDPIQSTVADLWAEVLGVAAVGVESDFFDLGGDSLVALQVIARIRDQYQVELPVRALFEQSTVGSFAACVEEALIAKVETLSEEAAAELLGSLSHD